MALRGGKTLIQVRFWLGLLRRLPLPLEWFYRLFSDGFMAFTDNDFAAAATNDDGMAPIEEEEDPRHKGGRRLLLLLQRRIASCSYIYPSSIPCMGHVCKNA